MNSHPAEQRKPRQSFFKHLLKSHMSIAAIVAFSLLFGLVIIFFQAGNVRILSHSSIPVAQASSSVLRGVQHSLASLRGWVSLNDKGFVQDWYNVWEDEIDPAVIKLEQLGPAMDLPAFNKRMAELSLLLAELKESQWWALEVAQTPGNEPARVKYQFEVEPILRTLDEIIRTLLDTTGERLTVSFQNAEMKKLHEMGISFYAAREMLGKIIFQEKVGLEDQYRYNLQALTAAVSDLSLTLPASDRFNNMMTFLKSELVALNRVSTEAIAIRKSNNWNVVRHLMETETVPLAKRVVRIMNGLTRDTDNLMVRQAMITDRTGNFAFLGLSVLLVVMIFAAVMISRQRAMALSRPVTALAAAANQLAAGTLSEDISPASDDELGDLTRSFNTMRRNLQDTQDKMVRHEKLAAIGKLAGSVAHDIRNPLGAISNSIYFLARVVEQGPDDNVLKHLIIMDREINRANNIISDLMDFSRDNVPTFEEGNINILLQEVLACFSFSDNISLDLQLDTGLPIILFDHSQLQRVFHNIMTNARQAMPDGGTLRVRTDHDDEFVRITISDTGHGIAEEYLDKIFEPLFTTKAKGVGLGLSIVKDFIEKNKGCIVVDSEEGKGTKLTITLPVMTKD